MSASSRNQNEVNTQWDLLEQCFWYKCHANNNKSNTTKSSSTTRFNGKNTMIPPTQDTDMSYDLLSSLLSFLSIIGGGKVNIPPPATTISGSESTTHLLKTTPELYDVTVQILALLNVLLSTHLYQPMQSSYQWQEEEEDGAKQSSSSSKQRHDTVTKKKNGNFFMDKLISQAYQIRQLERKAMWLDDGISESGSSILNDDESDIDDVDNTPSLHKNNGPLNEYSTSLPTTMDTTSAPSSQQPQQHQQPQYPNTDWSSQSILSSCLTWFIDRLSPPSRSIANLLTELSHLVANNIRGEMVGPDGMYETHTVVMARNPHVRKDGDGSGSNGANGESNGDGKDSGSHDRRSRTTTPKFLMNATHKVIDLSSALLLLPYRLLILTLRILGKDKDQLLKGKVMSSSNGSSDGKDDYKLAQLQSMYGKQLSSGSDGGALDSVSSSY